MLSKVSQQFSHFFSGNNLGVGVPCRVGAPITMIQIIPLGRSWQSAWTAWTVEFEPSKILGVQWICLSRVVLGQCLDGCLDIC